MKKLLIILILFSSCVTQKKVEKYIAKHPDIIEEKIVLHINTVHDTTIIEKDSLIIEHLTDTLYNWFTEYKYIDKVKIKEILKPCKDSIKIVKETKYVDLYKEKYKEALSRQERLDKSMRWWRKGFWLLAIWVTGAVVLIIVIKRKL